jgi:VanZ family protein
MPSLHLLSRRREQTTASGQSAALPLAIAIIGLVIYASLYPFTGWFWPAGATLGSLIVPPWPKYHIRFDIWTNFLGYMPVGALVFMAAVRRGVDARWAVVLGMVGPSVLSWVMEFSQHFVPTRVPSLMDWTLNSLGAVAGVLLAGALEAAGLVDRWHVQRERWFAPHSGTTVALLLLWPAGFLFPSPVPFGLGPSWERLQQGAYELLAEHPWAPYLDWLWAGLGNSEVSLSPAAEGVAEALGMLGPCLVAFTVTRPGWRRAVLVVLALAVGFGANTLSSALNFGPTHGLAWVTPVVPAALAVGTIACLMCLPLGRRACAALGLVALSAGTMLVAQAPSDPYYAASLAGWEQGRFIHFHGLAEWVGWAWPFLAGAALFARLLGPTRIHAGSGTASRADPRGD